MLDSLTHFAPADVMHRWPDEGQRWVQEPRKHAPGLDSLLTWAFRENASRIGMQTGHPVWVGVHGCNYRATRASLDEGEFAQIVNHLYAADGMARLQGGKDLDTAYAIPIDRSTRLRFRLNATPTRTARRDGGNIVLRPIADMPPSLEAQLVEPGILDAYRPREGMVIVSGGTGSGKSTLIAGMTVAKLLDPEGHCNIVEGAAPVEFLLERVRGVSSTMNQSEIPRDMECFAAFKRVPSAHAEADATLLQRIRTVHATSRATYGVPRVHAELRAGGRRHGRKRIARLMREAGLVGVSRRRGGVQTTRRDREARPAPDLVDRDFSANGPNQLWVADITFVPTAAGFLYLAVVLDAWSRKIVGWSMANHPRTELVLDALDAAVAQRRPRDVIHHSDQGSQYTSLALAGAVGKRGCGRRWAAWVTPTTTRCARASSPHSSASCWRAAGSRRRPRRASPSSASSKAGTTPSGCTPPWVTAPRSTTSGRCRRLP